MPPDSLLPVSPGKDLCVSFRCLEGIKEFDREAFKKKLQTHQLVLMDSGRGEVGIVCVGEVNENTFKQISSIKQQGVARLLVVCVSGNSPSAKNSWQLLESGANDVICLEAYPQPAAMIAARINRWRTIDQIVLQPIVQDNLIGRSKVWMRLLKQVVEVAFFSNASVLVIGESGTGKELVARLIHALDTREEKKKLVTLDCSTLVPELAGSEFFGHEKGAYTSALSTRQGAFEDRA